MKILVTGTEGYIGAVLAPALRERGHQVTGLDTGYYADGWLYGDPAPATHIYRDIRSVSEEELAGFDAVVHLAELSNDPLGQLNPQVTYAINHLGGVALARKAKAAGVPRFVYTSSCSVYGLGSDDFRTEESEPDPQTAYAHCKILVERDVAALAGDDFSPTFLRNATVFGPSPRMRFDLVLNNLCGLAWTSGAIKMISDGTPWRPIVHVLDVCEAIACALDAPREAVHNQIFNVGDSGQNYRVREIALLVAEAFPGCELVFGASDPDNRSYRVSFEKIARQLPSFKCRYDAAAGAQQLREIFERIDLSRATFEHRAYTRTKQLQHLLTSGQLDDKFFWAAPQPVAVG